MIPEEIILHIFSYLNERDLYNVSLTCRKFHALSSDEKVWKELFHRTFSLSRAYIHPKRNPSLLKVDPSQLSWKEQFKVMHGALHVVVPEGNHADKKSPKVQADKGIFPSIDDAMHAAEPYQFIIVHKLKSAQPHSLNLVIDKPVILIGADLEGEVAIESQEDSVILFTETAADCGVVNLKLKCVSTLFGQANYSLNVGPGCSPIIDHCDISTECFNGAAVYVHGERAKPLVKNCEIHHSNCVGVFIEDCATGTFQDCDIHDNKLAGVWVKSRASPRFVGNKVHHGKDCGFFIFDQGKGYLEGNDIFANRIAGVEIKNKADPILFRNNIHHGQTGGVYIHEKGFGQFIENRIHCNTYAGVWVTGESEPTLKDNEICDGQQGGVYFFGNGRGLLEGNNIHGNALAGIQIRSGSNPIIRNNQIHHGQHGGLYVHDFGKGLIEGNEIHRNALAGIWVTTGSEPILRRNRIHSGKQVGIYFYDNGGGVVEECHIFNHAYSGIQIRSRSNPTIRNNAIYAGRNGGLLIYSAGQGVIEDNTIHGNALANIWIKTDSNPVLRRNKIYGGKEGGVCIFNKGRGVLEDNEIFLSALTGVLVNGSNPILRRNKIFNGQSAGLEITNGGGGVYEDNEVCENKAGGVCVASGCNATMKGNVEYDNGRVLEDALDRGQCLFSVSTDTGAHCYPMHHLYRCLTCKVSETTTICENCIKRCHHNHKVEYVRYDKFFCDCGSGGLKADCVLTGIRTLTTPKGDPCMNCAIDNEYGIPRGQLIVNSPTLQQNP
jgi:F-box protein 11